MPLTSTVFARLLSHGAISQVRLTGSVFPDGASTLFRSAFRGRLLAICLVSLAFAVVGPGRAHAACGDYLFHSGSHGWMPAQGASASDRPADPSPLRMPCNGPGCRNGAPMQPIAPSTPTDLTRHSDHVVASVARDFRLASVSVVFKIEIDASASAGYVPGINRPPRQV
jgi:hypothetical protein